MAERNPVYLRSLARASGGRQRNPQSTLGACHTRVAFTLVELVLVLAVMGLIAGMAVPWYGQFLARGRLDAVSRRIAADLALAQRHARFHSKGVLVKFHLASNSLVMEIPDLDRPKKANGDQNNYSVALGSIPYEATLVSADFGGDSELYYDGYGAADTGGTVVLRVGSFQKSLVLDSSTGVVTIP